MTMPSTTAPLALALLLLAIAPACISGDRRASGSDSTDGAAEADTDPADGADGDGEVSGDAVDGAGDADTSVGPACTDASDCDDEDPCTTDSCDPAAGCEHALVCAPITVAIGEPAQVNEGSSLERSGSFSGDAAEAYSATVQWSGPGLAEGEAPLVLTAEGEFTLSRAFPADGAFEARVTVRDAHGRSGQATLGVTVANVDPTVALDPLVATAEGALWEAAGLVSDPGADVAGVTVDYADGSPVEEVALDAAGAFALAHVFADDGPHAVVLTVTDSAGPTTTELDADILNVAPSFEAPSDRVVTEGTPRTLRVSVSDPGADTVSAEVAWEPGAAFVAVPVADGAVALVLDYPDEGNHTVSLRLSDEDGGTSTAEFVVAVVNAAPVLAALPSPTVAEGELLEVDAPFADPGSDDWSATAVYESGSGITAAEVEPAVRSVRLTHRWVDEGTYPVLVRLDDGDGGTDEATMLVGVENAPPAAHAGPDAVVDEGTAFAREAVASDPGVADALTGTVRWGFGGPEEDLVIDPVTRGYRLERTFADDGEHEVLVRVVDGDGGESAESFTLEVLNVAPTVSCGGPATLSAGGTLTRACTFTDPGADSWTATVNYGEGGSAAPLAIAADGTLTVTHTFALEGTYEVVVSVRDGAATGSATIAVAVGNAPPLVDAGAATATLDEGGRWVRGGQAFDASAGPFGATVDYGDGGGAQPLALDAEKRFSLDHVYRRDGAYTARVTVTEEGGASGSAVVAVTVRNGAPMVLAGGAAALAEGGRLARAVAVSDAGPDDVVTATVDYGDGGGAVALPLGAGGAATLDHVYARDGSYTVIVRAADEDGGSGQASFAVAVSNVAPVVEAGGAAEAVEGAVFARSVSFADPGADVWTGTVAWGDGTPTVNLSGLAKDAPIPLAHTFANEGAFTVVVKVSDGATTGQASFVVTVGNAPPSVAAGGDAAVDEGAGFERTVALADAGAGDVLTATVDWGAGGGAQPVTVGAGRLVALAHTWPADGEYTVRVVASDGKATGEGVFVVTVRNVAPVVAVGAAVTLNEGETLSRVFAFSDPGADTWTATVDWGTGGGALGVPVGEGQTIPAAHAFGDDGTYDVVVRVSDKVAVGEGKLAVKVLNVAPTVSAGGPVTVAEGGTLARTVTIADPGVSDTFTARVVYGDGGSSAPLTVTSGRTAALSHVYVASGAYTVVVTVTDHRGAVGTDSFVVTVSNSAPLVAAGADAVIDEGARLVRAVPFTDPGDSSWTATVNYGLGAGAELAVVDAVARTVAVDRVYRDEAEVDVVVAVNDYTEVGQGSFGLTVRNLAPSVSLAAPPQSLLEGAFYSLAGSVSDPGPDDTVAAEYRRAGGAWMALTLQADRTFAKSLSFADDGAYPVEVRAADDSAAMGSASVVVQVVNVAPNLPDAPAPSSVPVGSRWQRAVSFTDPGADTWSVRAQYGDGSAVAMSTTATRSFTTDHVYLTPGPHTATFTVIDDDMGQDTMSVAVTVTNVAPTVEAGPARTVAEGTSLAWTASFADPGLDTHTASFSWGDGSVSAGAVDEDAKVAAASHTYADDGPFDAVVTVEDAYGGVGSATVRVDVVNVAPVVAAGGNGAANALGIFSRQISFTDPGADTWTVDVDYGDGGTETFEAGTDRTFSLSHVYATAGTFVVSLSVADGDGGVGTATFSVTAAPIDCTEPGGSTNRIWLGGAAAGPTSWAVADNWYPPIVPAASTLVTLCAGNTHYPRLSSDVTIGQLRMASAATVDTGAGRSLTIAGDLVGGRVVGTGKVRLTAQGAVARGHVPHLLVTAAVALAGDLSATGDVTLHDGGGLAVGPYRLAVGGDLSVTVTAQAGSGLALGHEDGVVDVAGDASFLSLSAGSAGGPSLLAAGELWLRGALLASTAPGSAPAFAPTGLATHLDGGGAAQPVTLNANTGDRLADLVLEPGAHLELVGHLRVDGLLVADGPARAEISGGWVLDVAGVDVTALDMVGARLELHASPFVRLDDVRFSAYGDETPLTITASTLDAVATRLRFATVPVGGFYIEGHGSGSATPAKLTVTDSQPAYGRPRCTTSGGFTLVWGDGTEDTDADQLADTHEYDRGTDPLDPDSDDDSFLDGTEVGLGKHPLLATSVPFTLGAPLELPVGAAPSRVIAGDFNADDILDLAVSNTADDSVTLWYGEPTASTTFTDRRDFALPSGSDPEGLASTEVGGLPVLFVAASGRDELLWAWGAADDARIFSVGRTVDTCASPMAVVAGMLDATPGPEIAVACQDDDLVHVLRTKSNALPAAVALDGAFYGVGAGPLDLAMGDLTGDTRPDLVTANHESGTVTVLRNSLFGVPADFVVSATLNAPAAHGLTAADLDGDGDLDLAVALADSGELAPFTNGGFTVGLTPGVRVAAGTEPRTVSAGDFDGNGARDLATAAYGSDAAVLLLGATGAYAGQRYRHVVPGPADAGEHAALLADLDGDGALELIVLALDREVLLIYRRQ